MSAIISSFSAFSPSYQNIANRMNRLKQHKQSHSLTQIRPNSARKAEINVFTIDPRETSPFKTRRGRLSPTNITFTDTLLTSDKHTGRVTKNTGLKKYNQRQLRDIADGKNSIHLKTEDSSRGNLIPCVNQYSGYNLRIEKDEIKMKDDGCKFKKNVETSLIPGRIYTRQALTALLA